MSFFPAAVLGREFTGYINGTMETMEIEIGDDFSWIYSSPPPPPSKKNQLVKKHSQNKYARIASFFGSLGFLGQQHGLDVRQYASLRDGHPSKQLVELLVIPDGKLEVTRDDPGLLIVPGRVAGQF